MKFSMKMRRMNLCWAFPYKRFTKHLIPDLVLIFKAKMNSQFVDFAAAVDQQVNIKESENQNKYLDLARELNILKPKCNNGKSARNTANDHVCSKTQGKNYHTDCNNAKISNLIRVSKV